MSAVVITGRGRTANRAFARARAAEREAARAAAQIFATVEQMCPLRLRAFSREEMWREVYLAHRQNERAAPALSSVDGTDIRQPLCGEEIESREQYLLHGDYPVALVTLFRPPTPMISAGMMRLMTANPTLAFRHTTVASSSLSTVLTPKRSKANIRIKRAQVAVSRSLRLL